MLYLLGLLVIIGILIFLFSRFSFPISGEAGVASELESLASQNEEYYPFNNVILKTPDGTTQIDHILISRYGIFVIETKDFKGWIFGTADQRTWTQSLYGPFYTSSKYHFQNPIRQNYKHVMAVESYLGIETQSIFNLVVFTGESEFKTDMPENVLYLHNLLPYIQSQTRVFFTSEKARALSQKLMDYVESASESEEEHFNNLVKNMIHPTCPRCGKSMILREAKKGTRAGSEFWGCPNFPECRVTKNVTL